MPTYEGTILDTGGAVLNVKSSTFGAVGNGIADDTVAIQAAVNAAAAGRGVVVIPPGTYLVTTITVPAGITIEGYGATLRRPANQGKWVRTLNVPETGGYSGDADSPLLTIRGLTIDGNSANQGPYRNYELEQAHLIFLSADPTKAGRLRVALEDLVLRNCVADGVSVYRNVDLQMVNCRADD
ncbi:MAG TPA: glycosyl hydrolase family 28-related protein, partial [Longimicrobium sp.]